MRKKHTGLTTEALNSLLERLEKAEAERDHLEGALLMVRDGIRSGWPGDQRIIDIIQDALEGKEET